ncbi:MAG: ABC transporter ATP-binding protein [Clostridia bacterium]|nr:ABC transporter ATP-binding protein [Clostridia bacterium]
MIKTLAKSIREYKKYAILTPIFMIFEVGFEIAIPYLLSILIDQGITNRDFNKIIIIGVCLVAAAFLALLFGRLGGRSAAIASSGFAKNLREDMYNKVQDFSFINIDKFSTSSIVTRLTSDVTFVQQAFMMIIRGAIRSPITIIFALIMSFSINTKIGLIFLIASPFLGGLLIAIAKYVHPIFRKVFNTIDKLNNVVQENVNGIRVVKSFVKEEKEVEKFNKVSSDIYDYFSKAEKILAFNGPIMQITIYTCLTLISWFGAHFVVAGTLTTGELTSLFSYVMQLLMNLMMLSMIFVMIIISLESGERIAEIIEEVPDLKNPENPIMKVENGNIEFKNVSFSYVNDKEKEVLKNINLKINSGETVGIIGGTGDGKSSLVNLIPRLYDALDGEVLVGDKNVKDYDIKVLRDEVSMVLQKNTLFSGTIKENLRWGNKDATDEELEKVCKLAQADEFIQKFPDKYDTYIEQGGNNVSGGQKQRLCIARALLKKPKILILDDSTSAVDTKTDSLIRKAFAEEIPNTTKLIIAQRIASVQDSDKIIILNNGEIDAIGNHEDLLKTNKIYQEIYYSQTKGSEENE